MKYRDLEKYYLCAIASNGVVYEFKVGLFDKKRNSFSFPNGDLQNTEIFKDSKTGGCTIFSAICLQEIDDAGFLYKEQDSTNAA